MPSDARLTVTPQLAIGFFIMIAGILLALERLNVLEAVGVLRLWPAVPIAIGGSMLLRAADAKGRFWGWTLVLLGSWLLLNTLGIVRVGFWQLFWPLVLIFLGVKIVSQALGGGSSTSGASTRGGGMLAVMSEAKRAVVNESFQSAQMTAVMGGCQLDLRQASLAPGEEAVVTVFAVMGGLEIWLPSGWILTSEVVPIMGGVEDKRLPPLPPPSGAGAPERPPRLILRGHIIMGGLTIKN
jgi:hypothetical protein